MKQQNQIKTTKVCVYQERKFQKNNNKLKIEISTSNLIVFKTENVHISRKEVPGPRNVSTLKT